ncbi:MAG: hypothetical protein Q7S07_01860 [Candidatus Omnitrophota bacterium]|nr:hypothetical protein [Candidatus Omnitrophota bacterium]
MNIRSKGGIALLIALAFLALFLTLAVVHIATTTSDLKIVKRTTDSLKAFSLAESGAQKALYELRRGAGWTTYNGEGPLPIIWAGLSKGEYEVIVDLPDVNNNRRVVSTGYFPQKTGSRATRSVEAEVSSPTPADFYSNAIYAGEDVDLNGNYTVNGPIVYGDEIDPSGLGTQSTVDFPLLNFEQLRAMAVAQVKANGQNNLYTQADITGGKPFPASFWFVDPTGIIPENTVPNVVYVETNLTLNGNIPPMGGFYVVAGDVLTDPSGGADSNINGTGTIDGCVYTLGDFRINGGGNGLGITGGVWGRDEVRLNGNATVTYNASYMASISTMDIGFVAQIISWKEKY